MGRIDAAGLEPARDEMSGVGRNWSVNAHCRSIIAGMGDAFQTQVLIAGAGPIGLTASSAPTAAAAYSSPAMPHTSTRRTGGASGGDVS